MATPLRIALDGLPLQVRSAGVASYVRGLVGGLAALDADLELRLVGLPWPAPAPRDAGWPAGVRAAPALGYPLAMGTPLPLPRLLSAEAAFGDADLFHATAYAMPRARRTPVVLTVHDLTLLRLPEVGTAALRRSVRRAAAEAGAARLVIADSEATRRDLIELAGVAPAAIRVVPLGVGAEFRPQPVAAARAAVTTRFGLTEPYLLHLGTVEPRKNLPLLVEACARLWREGRLTHRLVLAGPPGWGSAALEASIARHGVGDRVRRLGRVADAERPALYGAADAVLIPSVYEGFGLPLLEAMACGAPAVASDAGALPEVAGDAALLLDPRDAQAWAEAIAALLGDPALAARLRTAGPPRAAAFTWARCARETLAVYREAVA